MVCILCDSKTKITNSRFMRRSGYTWRRHTCPRCSAVYTTREYVDMANSYRLQHSDGSLEPILREKLLLSVIESTKHRSNSLEDSTALTDTILAEVLAQKRLVIEIETLRDISSKILRRFDKTTYVRYLSMYS